jgi:hypothetical protein
MTIQSQTSSISYTGNRLDQTWLQVYINGVLKTLTTDYSVSGVGSASGGNITFVTAPSNGSVVYIARSNIPTTQLVDYTANDSFPAETHEEALDKLTMLIQQLTAQANRSIRLNRADTAPSNTELALVDKKDKLLMFNVVTADAQVTDITYSFLTDTLSAINQYIAEGINLLFPMDLGFISDPIINYTYDLGGLS